ncbi:MAG: dTDP-4-dehydrorhamnose reductase [Pleurocapsa sp.]
MTKILLTGISGQVGGELQQTLLSLGEIIAVNRQQLDLTQPQQIAEAIATIKPDIIVNAAAYTSVDKAETETDLAMAINATAPQVIAEAAAKIQATVVHISTDYVFNGQNHLPYTETDATDPLGVYGKSKLLGEEAVRNKCDRHIIIRTAWVYGCRGHGNFVKTMLRLGAERTELKVVADQIGSPTWSYDLSWAIAQILAQLPSNLRTTQARGCDSNSLRVPECPALEFNSRDASLPLGTYHFTNSGVASWYDLAIAIFEEAKLLGFELKIGRVIPIATIDYPTSAQRPAYSVLDKQKITQLLGEHPPHWRESLKAMLAQWQSLK